MNSELAIPTNESTVVRKARLPDLDRAKGLAILLVVIGHIVARNGPKGNSWYADLQEIIYTFHMPFFMYLSGFVAFRSSLLSREATQTFDILKKKAKRLIVPFVLFGVAIILAKHFGSLFLYVDNMQGDLLHSLINIFWDTSRSEAVSIWYLYVLFVFWLITAPVVLRDKNHIFFLLAIAICIYWVALPDRFYLPRGGEFYVFFLLGGVAAYFEDLYSQALDRMIFPAVCVFLISLGMFYLHLDRKVQMLISGVASIPAIHGLMRSQLVMRMRFLLTLGKYCMSIYLLNTIFIGLTKGVMFHFFDWDGNRFLVYFVMLGAAGLFLPIFVKRYVFSRVRLLDSITD